MYSLENIKNYKKNALSIETPSATFIKMFDFTIKNCKLSKIALEKTDVAVFYKSITKADKMFGYSLEILDSLQVEEQDFLEQMRTIYFSVARKFSHIIKNKDEILLDRITAILENLRSMWVKLLGQE